MHRNTIGLVGIGVIALVWLLERGGVWLYLGYTLERVMVVFLGLTFLLWGVILLRKHNNLEFALGVLVGTSLLMSAWMLGHVVSSPRKRFYLLAEQVRAGDSIEHVKRELTGYDNWSGDQDHISFRFSQADTMDVLMVHYDPSTGKVLDTDLSLD